MHVVVKNSRLIVHQTNARLILSNSLIIKRRLVEGFVLWKIDNDQLFGYFSLERKTKWWRRKTSSFLAYHPHHHLPWEKNMFFQIDFQVYTHKRDSTLRELILARTNFGVQQISSDFLTLVRTHFGEQCLPRYFVILARTNFSKKRHKSTLCCLILCNFDEF